MSTKSAIAARVASEFGTNHTVLRAEELGAEALLELLGRLDEPFCDPTLVPALRAVGMTQAAREGGALRRWGRRGVRRLSEVSPGPGDYPSDCHFRRAVRAVLRRCPWRPRGVGRVYCRTLSARGSHPLLPGRGMETFRSFARTWASCWPAVHKEPWTSRLISSPGSDTGTTVWSAVRHRRADAHRSRRRI